MKRTIFAVFEIGLVLVAGALYSQLCHSPLVVAADLPSGADVNTSVEFSNGTLGNPYEDLAVWYDWINASNTQVIFLAYQSYMYNPPLITFLGQHYYANSTEVFVGNTLTLMEIYNDTNGNGLPDADYVTGTSEIVYYYMVNSSQSFAMTPIEKTIIDGVPHYSWGFRYQTIDGFFMPENLSSFSRVMLDHMDFSYDFYVQNNVSYIKSNFGIGRITNITSSTGSDISMNGLSLALLYETFTVTPKPYETLVNGDPYNSTVAPASVVPVASSQITIESATAYEVLFGQNYSLHTDSGQETYESKSTAVSSQSVSGVSGRSVEWILYNLESVISGLFPKMSNMQISINLDYDSSSFLYRVCYPVWGGNELQHDPTYVAYLGMITVPEISTPMLWIAIAAVAGLASLAAALIDVKRTKKILNPPAIGLQ